MSAKPYEEVLAREFPGFSGLIESPREAVYVGAYRNVVFKIDGALDLLERYIYCERMLRQIKAETEADLNGKAEMMDFQTQQFYNQEAQRASLMAAAQQQSLQQVSNQATYGGLVNPYPDWVMDAIRGYYGPAAVASISPESCQPEQTEPTVGRKIELEFI